MISPGFTAIFLAAILAMFTRCSQSTGGAGGETTNGCIMGTIKLCDGSFASAVLVRLFPADYDPVKDTAVVPTETTDSLGRYTFSSVAPGGYNVQAIHVDNSTKALVSGIQVGQDMVTAHVGILEVPGAIKISIPTGSNGATGYFYIPGSDLFVFLNNHNDFAVLDSVPAGTIPEVSHASKNSSISTIIRYEVPVIASDTTIIQNPSWNHSRTLILNTSAAGANVTSDIVNFPALIRLNADNFDFSQAQVNGGDLRFAKQENKMLSCEVERWDPVAKLAEIWVRVDTVFGNNGTQTITMYWGNPAAGDSSNGSAVFDTTNGFIGVWHMNEIPSTGIVSIRDHTINRYDATPFGSMTAANSVDGMIGKAVNFDGKNDYLNAGNISVPGNYTIGLWAQIDTLEAYHRFIYKDSSYTLWYDKDSVSIRMEHLSTTTWWRGLLQDGGTRVPMTAGKWFFITATFDGNVIRLYRNGSEMSISNVITVSPMANSKPLLLGGSKPQFTRGCLDEIRIEGTVRSADWIQLCYMNQKVNDKLILFK
jgi:hypothetical protein